MFKFGDKGFKLGHITNKISFILNKNVNDFNLVFISFFSLLFLFFCGIISFNINGAYSLFYHELFGEKTLEFVFNGIANVEPQLSSNMVPVYYDSNSVKKIDKNSSEWFNYDEGKWANAVTYNNNLLYNEVEKKEQRVFDGVDDFVILGSKEYDFKKSLSVVARVKLSSYSNTEYGIVGNPEGAGFYVTKTTSNRFSFNIYDSNSNSYKILTTNFTPELNKWYTIVGTYNGSVLKIYIDGVLNNSMNVSCSLKVSSVPIAIGANPAPDEGTVAGGHFNGFISDVIVMNKVLGDTDIAKNYGESIYHDYNTSNILYSLRFDGDNSTVYNGAFYSSDGMNFDGVDDYVSVGFSGYDFKETITLAARVKLYSYSQGEEYGILGNPNSAGYYLMKSSNDTFSVIIYDDVKKDYQRVSSSFVPELDTWYTVVATYDGAILKLYINGVLDNSLKLSTDVKLSFVPFMIGVNPAIYKTEGSHFDGVISDIMLSDEALTLTQVSNMHFLGFDSVITDKTLIYHNLRGYDNRDDGTIIPDEMINGMWVWIPRFSAEIFSSDDNIDIDLTKLNEISHDAFTFNGEQKLGFWVGKFENSVDANAVNTENNILIKPNKTSFINNNIGTMFNSIKNMTVGQKYGFVANSYVDAHLIKNNEWAAVSYFSQSKYGLCNKGDCLTLGNNTSGKTGGESYVSNVSLSITNNVYGVYDMNGGVSEFVMGNYNGALNSLDGFSSFPNQNYCDVYTNSDDYIQNNLQHAIFETNTIFNSGLSNFFDNNSVWLLRDNLFSYDSTTGDSGNIGSRTVLVTK